MKICRLEKTEIIKNQEDGQDQIGHHAEQHDEIKGGRVSLSLFRAVHGFAFVSAILTKTLKKSSGFCCVIPTVENPVRLLGLTRP